MNTLLDESLVGLVLVISAVYAAMSIGPRSVRRRMYSACSRLLASAPEFLGLRRASERLALAATDKSKGACGGCDNCGPEKESVPSSAAREISVPLAKIRLRHK